MSTALTLAVLAGLWVVYGLIHSVLASHAIKDVMAARWPRLMPAYRLAFNGLSLILLLPIAFWMWSFPGPVLWAFQGVTAWIARGLALAAVVAFWHSTCYYDMDEFLGLRQIAERGIRANNGRDTEPFVISPYHRWVRHPWYFFGLVILWCQDMNAASLVSALAITLYFIVGSKLEEKKLIAIHGDAYRDYMGRVPGLVPLPWKRLK